MKTKFLFFMLTSCCSIIFGQAPITLGNPNMPGSGDTLRYTNIQISSLGNYQQTGPNFNWNFNNVISTTEGVRSFISGLLTPYGLFFLSLNEYGEKLADTLFTTPIAVTNYYNFYKKQTNPNAFIADGAGISVTGLPLPSYYSDKDELYNFPMSYPKYDSTTFKFSTIASTLVPIRYSKSGYRVTKVDGWGTVTTPNGTDNCLRLVTTQYSLDSIKLSFGPIAVPFGFPNNQRSYQWLTTTSKIPFLEVTGTLLANNNFSVTEARYRGRAKSSTDVGINEIAKTEAVLLFPNPVKEKLSLNISDGAVFLTIYDGQGKLIKSENTDAVEGIHILDVSTLPAGLYFIKTISPEKQSYFKFIKQ